MNIRVAKTDDASSLLSIYAPYVKDTAVSFETDVPSLEEFKNRIEEGLEEYPWLVAEINDEVVGYAYSSKHRSRCAYGWSVDSSVYVSTSYQRKGIAQKLYEKLFVILEEQGAVNVFAGIALPNDGSVSFHESIGFKKIGIYKNVGYKLNRWHDVGWWQKELLFVDRPKNMIPFSKIEL
jgi:L-amino acid N-acyltransferase YncA